MSETLALTGASGFLGGAIRAAAPASTVVLSLGRHEGDTRWDMRSPSTPELGAASAVVHCAWLTTPRDKATSEKNITASLALLEAAKARSALFIFISSKSSNAATTSRYGRSKFAVEQAVLAYEHGLVIRPGTIQSASGSLGMLDETLGRLAGMSIGIRLKPDPQVPIVSLDRVVDTVWAAVPDQGSTPSIITLIDEWVPLGHLIEARRSTSPRITVPAPSSLVGLGARMGRALPLGAIRDSADSWLGLADAGIDDDDDTSRSHA